MKGNVASSLVEVLISISILALMAAPFLSMLAVSTQSMVKGNDILNASYIAQNQMEQLMGMSYCEALTLNQIIPVGKYYLKTQINPCNADGTLSCFHIIFSKKHLTNYEGLFVPPDGRAAILLEDLPTETDITIDISGPQYELSVNNQAMAGHFPTDGAPTILVNMIQIREDLNVVLSINGNADVLIYGNGNNGHQLYYEGEALVLNGFNYRDYSLVSTCVDVSKSPEFDTVIAQMKGILKLKN